MAENDGEYPDAVWCCSSKQLQDEVKRLYGEEYETTAAVGRAVKKLAPMLESKLGIGYDYKRTGASRMHVFKREII